MIEEMYRVHNKSIIIYIKIITDDIFIQLWHRLHGYTAMSLCHDCLIALAFTSWFLLFHHVQTTSALHQFIFIGAVYAIKSLPPPPPPPLKTTTATTNQRK